MSIKQGQAVLEHMKNFDVRPMIDKGDYMFFILYSSCIIFESILK